MRRALKAPQTCACFERGARGWAVFVEFRGERAKYLFQTWVELRGPADRAGVRISDIHRDFLTFHKFSKKVISRKISQNLDPKMEVTPTSRSTWHDAEVPTLAGPGPYLARANSRAQCREVPITSEVFRTGTMPRCRRMGVWQSRRWSLCAQLEGCASRYKRLRASVSTGLRSTTKVVRRDTFYSGQCNVMQT